MKVVVIEFIALSKNNLGELTTGVFHGKYMINYKVRFVCVTFIWNERNIIQIIWLKYLNSTIFLFLHVQMNY